MRSAKVCARKPNSPAGPTFQGRTNTLSSPAIAVLLTQLGTPDAPTPTAVRRFLREFLSDPRVVDLNPWLWLPLLHGIILPFRSRRSARLYQKIW
ncbi:MAG: ferrochelatase, partial [Magnetococcales bacterium]|nr:ferrochelatase [Magnetococcales bacterium]